MSAVITPFEGTELFNTASFNNRISQINTGFSYVSNPNLLDNWYFGRPVNQRGKTSWTNPSDWQYAIDRWQITPSSVIALVDGGITITADFHQGLEKDRLEFGRTYTFSVLSSDGRLGKHTFVLTSDTDINGGFGFGYFVCYLSGDSVWFRIYGDGSTYKAAKLELGSTQTLAHREGDKWVLNEIPDYGEQLRRCQRYFVRLGFSNTDYCIIGGGIARDSQTASVMVPLPTKMRTNFPAVSITGQITLRHSDAAFFLSTRAFIDAGGVGTTLLKCVTSGLTAGDAVEAFLAPQNYVDLSAEL